MQTLTFSTNVMMHSVYILLIFEITCVLPQLLGPSQFQLSDDGRLTFPDLAAKYGHPAKTVEVTTEDGYILTLFHIPGNETCTFLLVHGNLDSADAWVLRGNISLGITLANRGCDVWALNLRGSRYSRRHITLDPGKDSAKFFNYTFYEHGIYDLPTTIDHILKETGQEQIIYIGHSAATTSLYVLGAEKPEYNDKIKLHVSLAPVCFFGNFRVPSNNILSKFLLNVSPLVGIYELFNYKDYQPIVKATCLQPLGYEVCVKGIFFQFFGFNEEGIEPNFTNTLFGHWPCGSSAKYHNHQSQVGERNKFAKYNYGASRNMVEYGSATPPEFNLTNVRMKTALFVGTRDPWTYPDDVARLMRALPNVVHYEKLPYEKFSHADFVYNRHLDKHLLGSLFKVLQKYVNI